MCKILPSSGKGYMALREETSSLKGVCSKIYSFFFSAKTWMTKFAIGISQMKNLILGQKIV
jgi:hypothetical protein